MKITYILAAVFYCCLPSKPLYKAVSPDMPDIVINEILFNPRPGGVDYLEIYNRSKRTIDLNGWHIANRNATGAISSSKVITSKQKPIAPGEYRVITEDTVIVQRQYYSKDLAAFLQLSSMPSYPDASGTVVLLDVQNNVIDEFQYNEKWHFKLISDPEGVALERIDANKPTQDPNNWHSAAASVGYGTPSYKNSQYFTDGLANGTITIEPRVFSPDNDGLNDYAMIKYQFSEPGYVCNLTIFNVQGNPVRYLLRNGLCGKEGYYKWDGLDEKNKRLAIGTYILLAEVFNLKGKTAKYKELITLSRKF